MNKFLLAVSKAFESVELVEVTISAKHYASSCLLELATVAADNYATLTIRDADDKLASIIIRKLFWTPSQIVHHSHALYINPVEDPLAVEPKRDEK